jgi:molybdenum cofactor cytidylyltransferase
MENPEIDKRPTAGIILAAGMSVRFGSLKHLLRVGKTTILSMVIDAAVRSDLDRVVLVLGYRSDKIITTIGDYLHYPKLRTVINPRYQEGMSGSIQRGLMEIKDEFPSVMIILGDHPLLDTATINMLLDRFRSSDKFICVPTYKGTKGLPVCFGKRFYADIMDITGDIGAREIMQKNPEHVLTVEIDNPDCFFDVDNNGDMEELLSRLEKIKA